VMPDSEDSHAQRRATDEPETTNGGVRLVHLGHDVGIVREGPEDAVVVPGSRPAKGAFAEARGLQLATAVIVKYRDSRTDAATALESALR